MHDVCHINRLSYVPNDSDGTAFNEGARAIGLYLQEQVQSRPRQYLEMLAENQPEE